MNHQEKAIELHKGKHLSMVARGRWEYVTRNTQKPAVGIIAVTNSNQVVLVEQFRPPVEQNIVELPAGLAGDISGAEDEAMLEAAKRELLEETGYEASEWTELLQGFSSPGLTDESIVFFLARGLTKVGPGGGDESEQITMHEVPIDGVAEWVASKNVSTDLKLWAGLYLAGVELENSN